MSRIILCGASSVGKTTLAQDWCSKNRGYAHINEVVKDVMVELKITRHNLETSLSTRRKELYFQLQKKIFEEQNRREKKLEESSKIFVSERGPDPLVYTFLESVEESEYLCEHIDVKECLDRYRKSLVVVLCPLENTTDDGIRLIESVEYQYGFTDGLHRVLRKFGIAYMFLGERDRERRLQILQLAVDGTVPIPINQFMDCPCLSFYLDREIMRKARYSPPFLPLPRQGKEARVRTFDLNPKDVILTYPPMDNFGTNRMVDRYGEDNFILIQFHSKLPNDYIRDILRGGVYVNGEEYRFLGCSSSGLKSRKCYLLKGKVDDVIEVLDQCGNFSQIKMVSKRLKRISQLFSVAKNTEVKVPDDKVEVIDDIETRGGNFTDGCGFVGLELAERLAKGCNASIDCPKDGIPTVFQIRFHGCKGIIVKNPELDKKNEFWMQVRPSMKKFKAGKVPFPEVWVCEHSRPYSYGHLNKQYIMLLSGLGIRDEVFLLKQEEYFEALENMLNNPEFAIIILNWRNRPDLANKVAACKTEEDLKRGEIQLPLKFIRSKLILKLEKLSIPILDSRTLFGICDPLSLLSYGECFVRISAGGQPKTLQPGTKVTVGKNPCYLLGDIRVLIAVDYPELEHLVDCIVFPVKGKSPHSAEIAGSDLDGDQYLVCWDKALIPPHTVDPYDYPSVEAFPSDTVTRDMMIDYFAGQKNMMGKINDYFQYWADLSGPGCFQCEQLGRWFSRSVDSSKTGDTIRLPGHLIPPRADPNSPSRPAVDTADKVWNRMQVAASECMKRLTNDAIDDALANTESTYTISEKFIRNLLVNRERSISEYKLFNLICKWCHVWHEKEKKTENERKDKLIELSDFINFGVLTFKERIEAVQLGIPIEKVMNALNKSKLLNREMLQRFSLDIPACGWKFYTRESTLDIDWSHLVRAMREYPETMLIVQLDRKERLAFHFVGPFEEGKSVIPIGSFTSYFFSPSFHYQLRYVTECEYNLNLTDGLIQFYRDYDVKNTFLWLNLKPKFSEEMEYPRISIDLTNFKRTILRIDNHPLIIKQEFYTVEIFVKSKNMEDIAYLDIHDTYQMDVTSTSDIDASEILEELSSEEEDTGEADPTQYTPFAPETSLLALKQFAKKGDCENFSKVLAQIPNPTAEMPEPFPRPKLIEEVLSLFANLANKNSHKKPSESLTENLYAILKSPHLLISSAKELLKMYTSLSKLQCFVVISQHLDRSIEKLYLSTIAEYFECVFNWELWTFLPWAIACQLLDRLYILVSKLDSLRIPIPSQDADDIGIAIPQTIQDLARSADADPPPVDEAQRSIYRCYYAFLTLKHLLAESPDQEEYSKIKDSDNSVCKLRVMNTQDKRVNVELESSSEEETVAIPAAVTPAKKKKKSKVWKACFSRLNKLTTSKFTKGSFVRIRLLNRPESTRSNDPIALGNISVVSSSPAEITVDIPEPVPSFLKRSARTQKGYWSLTLVGNITSFKRSCKALEKLSTPGIISILISPQAFPPRIEKENTVLDFSMKSPEEVQLPGKNDPIINPHRSFDNCKACLARARTRYNESQENAITDALNQRVTLVHGPPGTGKTFVACEIVHQLYHRMKRNPDSDDKCKILVSAETNNAVDNLTQKLLDLNLLVVRVGKKSQIAKRLHEVSLEHQVEMKRIEQNKDKKGEFQSPKLKKEILNSVDIIAATCTGAGDSDMKTIKFSVVLIDEATQVIEPVSLISIAKSCQKLILIGDPKQLAPTLPNKRAMKEYTSPDEVPPFEALRVTLFHRLHRQMEPRFLDEQHRMHPYIAHFPSCVFYNSKLKTAVRKEDRPPPKVGFINPAKPVVFIDVSTPEFRTGSSFKNEGEANVIVRIVVHLIRLANYKLTEIGVLTPYAGQVRCIKEKLELVAKVDVCSIDGFQGKEKEVIIFSTVKNNEDGILGFTDSQYRINVLLTRAKCALIGVGDKDTLRNSFIWTEWTYKYTAYTKEEFYAQLKNEENEEERNDERSSRGRDYSMSPRGRSRNQYSYGDRDRRNTQNRRQINIGNFIPPDRQTQRNRNYGRMGRTASPGYDNHPPERRVSGLSAREF